jgi:hypothetical protein
MTDNNDENEGGLGLLTVRFDYLELDFNVSENDCPLTSKDLSKGDLDAIGYLVVQCIEEHLDLAFINLKVREGIMERHPTVEQLVDQAPLGVDHEQPIGGDI